MALAHAAAAVASRHCSVRQSRTRPSSSSGRTKRKYGRSRPGLRASPGWSWWCLWVFSPMKGKMPTTSSCSGRNMALGSLQPKASEAWQPSTVAAWPSGEAWEMTLNHKVAAWHIQAETYEIHRPTTPKKWYARQLSSSRGTEENASIRRMPGVSQCLGANLSSMGSCCASVKKEKASSGERRFGECGSNGPSQYLWWQRCLDAHQRGPP
mmetsp:Transcript_47912/g.138632  ORF Transcript_47912/g.138632 Transcript_47912/m.138632 type:complete len:210 (+) Transcript_47912:29-658(+)